MEHNPFLHHVAPPKGRYIIYKLDRPVVYEIYGL